MILEQLKKQFESISIDFKLKNDVVRLDAPILCRQFNYLDVLLKVDKCKKKCFAVTLDSSPNSIIFSLYCWFCGHQLVSLNPAEDKNLIKYKRNLFPESIFFDPKTIDFGDKLQTPKKPLYFASTKFLASDFLVTFTSGSTGKPKAVVHSRETIINCALAFNQVFPGKNLKRKFLHIMPSYYMAGLFNALFLPIILNCPIVLAPSFNSLSAIRFFEDLVDFSITDVWLAPVMMAMISALDRSIKFPKKMPAIFLCTGPANKDDCKIFAKKFGIHPIIGYGLSETLFVSFTDKKDKEFNTVGRCIPGVEVLKGSDGNAIIKTEYLAKKYVELGSVNYLQNPFITSDKILIDSSGVISFKGRTDDVIIRGGINIDPHQVEEFLKQNLDINDFCIVGQDNAILGQKLIFVSIEDIGVQQNTARQVIKKIDPKLDIDCFLVLDQIPKGPTGKVKRQDLKNIVNNALSA